MNSMFFIFKSDGNVIMESRKGVPFNFMDNIRTNLKKILSKNPILFTLMVKFIQIKFHLK